MSEREFLIVGGGIAGLATSLALARVGLNSEVFEQAPVFEETGAGLQISPNAVHCLRQIGAWDALQSNCIAPAEIHVRDGRSGAILQCIQLGKSFEARFGAPYRVARRSDLLRALLLTAESHRITLHTGSSVEKAENTAGGARLHPAGGMAIDGAAVVGADGINSTIRQTIIGDGKPNYGGHAIYRALIPFDQVPLCIAADCVTLWLYPGGHAVHYAVSNWRQFNVVVALESPWSGNGWGERASKAEVMNGFVDASDAFTELLACVPAWLKWAACDRPPTKSWSSGNLALIGDAAHPSLPYLAQGAAMALEDACVFAKCVASSAGIPTALGNYARERQPRTTRLQHEARQLGNLYHARGFMALARNTALRCLGPERALERNRWIYEWKP